MFLFPEETVYANDLQLVNRNQIPMVYKGRNHGILAYFTQLKSTAPENNTVGEDRLNLFPDSFLLQPQCT